MTIGCRLIAIAYAYSWCISHMDVKNVSFNGDLQEESYMLPLSGVLYKPSKVCKFKKALFMVSNEHLVLGLRSSQL